MLVLIGGGLHVLLLPLPDVRVGGLSPYHTAVHTDGARNMLMWTTKIPVACQRAITRSTVVMVDTVDSVNCTLMSIIGKALSQRVTTSSACCVLR